MMIESSGFVGCVVQKDTNGFMWTARNYVWENLPQGPPGAARIRHLKMRIQTTPPIATLPPHMPHFLRTLFSRSKGPQVVIGFIERDWFEFHMTFAMHGSRNDIFMDLIPGESTFPRDSIDTQVVVDRLNQMLGSLKDMFFATHVRLTGGPFVWRQNVTQKWLPAAEAAGFEERLINGNRFFDFKEEEDEEPEPVVDVVFYIDEDHLPSGIKPPSEEEQHYYFYKRKLDFLRDLYNQKEGATQVTLGLGRKERATLWKFYFKTFKQEMPVMFGEGMPNSLRNWLNTDIFTEVLPLDNAVNRAILVLSDALVVRNLQEWLEYFGNFPTKFPILFASAEITRLRHWTSLVV